MKEYVSELILLVLVCFLDNLELTFSFSVSALVVAVTGILRRCDKTGTCHPKTSSSLENIMHTKMQEVFNIRSLSERRCDNDGGDDWLLVDQSESIHSLPAERELTRHKVSFTSLSSSSEHENEPLNSSLSSLSCSTASQIDDEATHDIESGIFELEM